MSRVIVIDDSEPARQRIRAVLEESGRFSEILEASDGIAGLRAILEQPLDAVLCDLEMPGLDGEKLLRAHRGRRGGDEAPFFFLTAERDPERLARLLRAGAADTITKPFHPAELLARLETHLRLRKLRAELREKNAMLEKLSTTDPLTGLRSRRFVDEVLAIEVLRASRYHTDLTVLMADVDHFKRVNDAHGHAAGDAVLAHVGGVIAAQLRGTDVAGRYGGEEFVVVLTHSALDGAAVLAERMRAALSDGASASVEGVAIPITISVGVAQHVAGESAASLVRRADGALYAAKAAGRDRVALAPAPGVGVDTPAGKSRPGLPRRRSR